MINKIKTALAILLCFAIVLCVMSACSKNKESEDDTTLISDDTWQPGSDETYQPVEITGVELADFVSEVLGDEAKDFNGDIDKLSDDQLNKIKEEAKSEGYFVETDDSGKTVIKKNDIHASQASDKEVEEVLKKADVSNKDKLTDEEYEKVSKLAEKESKVAVTDSNGDVEIYKVTTRPTTTKPTTAHKTTTKKHGDNKPPKTTEPDYVASAGTRKVETIGINTGITNTFGGDGPSIFTECVSVADGVIAVGNTYMTPKGKKGTYPSGLVVKFTSTGKRVWKDIVSANQSVQFQDVAILTDGSIVVVGTTISTDLVDPSLYKCKGTSEGVIIKYDASGKKIWTHIFGGSGGDILYAVCATPDGGFVIGGKTDSTDSDLKGTDSSTNIRGFVTKLNSDGTIVWTSTMGGSKHAATYSLDTDESGTIYAVMQTVNFDGDFAKIDNPGTSRRYSVVLQISPDGKIKWTVPFYDEGAVNLESVVANGSLGCVVAGYYGAPKVQNSGSFKGIYNGGQSGTTDGIMIKISPLGEVVWILPFIGFQSDYIQDITRVPGGFAVTGYTTSTNRDFAFSNNGDYDSFVFIVSSGGKIQSSASFGGSDADRAQAVCCIGTEVFSVGATSSSDITFANVDCVCDGESNVAFINNLNLLQK